MTRTSHAGSILTFQHSSIQLHKLASQSAKVTVCHTKATSGLLNFSQQDMLHLQLCFLSTDPLFSSFYRQSMFKLSKHIAKQCVIFHCSFSWNSYIKEKHMTLIMKSFVYYNKASSFLYCSLLLPSLSPRVQRFVSSSFGLGSPSGNLRPLVWKSREAEWGSLRPLPTWVILRFINIKQPVNFYYFSKLCCLLCSAQYSVINSYLKCSHKVGMLRNLFFFKNYALTIDHKSMAVFF